MKTNDSPANQAPPGTTGAGFSLKNVVAVVATKGRRLLTMSGFSLVEIVAAVALIGILASVAIPGLSSSRAAVVQAKLTMPDLIVMDVVMPGMNGFQATRMITKEEGTKDIPVIICTTKGQETDKVWGMRQGAKAYLVKPIKPEDLLSKIKSLG